jgi:glutathione S-transferase
MKLYWYWSTNPQKVRLALEELALPYERITVDLFKGEHQTDTYRGISPRGKVPALEVDGTVLWESNAILTYLGEREARLWPNEPTQLAKALNLLFLEAAAFQDAAGVMFFNRVILPRRGKVADPGRMAKATTQLNSLFRVLMQQFTGPYLLGDFTLVDCAYAPWLPILDMDDFPELAAWRQRLMDRPSWEQCEFKYPLSQ